MATSSTQSQYNPQTGNGLDRDEIRRRARGNSWAFGLVLVVLGAALLFENFYGQISDNWAALLLLIPAGVCFSKAFQGYAASSYAGSRVRGNFFAGVVFTLLCAVLFFEISLPDKIIWPVVLILIGGGILINRALPE